MDVEHKVKYPVFSILVLGSCAQHPLPNKEPGRLYQPLVLTFTNTRALDTKSVTFSANIQEDGRAGLSAVVKKQILDTLDSNGGFDCVTNKSRTLQAICNDDPDNFGSPIKCKTPRNRRRQIGNFVDKFKRLSPKEKARKRAQIEKDATIAKQSPPPAQSKKKPQAPKPTSVSSKKLTFDDMTSYRSPKKKQPSKDDGKKPNCSLLCA
jgi:hypothetical protein